MKTNQIVQAETGKSRILFVKVPDDSRNFKWANNRPFFYETPDKPYLVSHNDYMPNGEWEVLGELGTITEERALLVADTVDFFFPGEMVESQTAYYDYTVGGYDSYGSAVKSIESLATSEDVFAKNPIPEKGMSEFDNDDKSLNENHYEYFSHLEKWECAQARTGRWLVLYELKTTQSSTGRDSCTGSSDRS